MENTNDLVYSNEGSANRYIFLKDGQDINIFVEDANREYEYEEIFKKLLPSTNIKAIFSTGGKIAMKERFKEFGAFDADSPSHPNVYIADGDFDRIISSETMVCHDHFIYLDAYNIEDYLFDETSCVKFAMGKLKISASEAKARINFTELYKKIVEQAKKLFVTYCFIQSNYPSIPTISNGAYIFINSKTGFERVGAFKEYKNSLLEKHGIDIKSESEKIRAIESKYKSIYNDEYWHLICGKFLMKSLMCYLGSKGIKPCREEELRWWLIDHINVSNLIFLSQQITTIIEKCKTSEV